MQFQMIRKYMSGKSKVLMENILMTTAAKIYLNNGCNNFCRHKDCVKTFYKPYVITSFANYSKDAQILISLPMEPKRIYCYKIETKEILCYLASILSL